MGARLGVLTDAEQRGDFSSVEEMREAGKASAPRPPRVALVKPTTMERLAEEYQHAVTASERYKPIIKDHARASAALLEHRDDFTDSGYAQQDAELTQKAVKRIAPELSTILGVETVGDDQTPNLTRDALRSQALDSSPIKDPGVRAAVAANARLRFDGMPVPKLIAAYATALAAGDAATTAQIEEVFDARGDDGPRAPSRQQRAEFGALKDRIDYGAGEAQIVLAKIKIIAHRARLDLGLVAPRETSRAKIRLGLMEMELAGLEKAAAKVAAK